MAKSENTLKLEAALPSIESQIENLKQSGLEQCGACPKCGGTDRFFIRKNGTWGCRQCYTKGSNEPIDFFKWRDDMTFRDLAKKYGISQPKKSKKKNPKNQSPKKAISALVKKWQNIRKAGIIRPDTAINYLINERGIDREYIEGLFQEGILVPSISAPNLEEKAAGIKPTLTMLAAYFTLAGKLVAVQEISVTGEPLTVNGKTKKYWQGSKPSLGFFGLGSNLPKTKTIILVEAVINALTLNSILSDEFLIIAIGGSTDTAKIKELVLAVDSKQSILAAYDNDGPGEKATIATANIFQIPINAIDWPENLKDETDVNDLLKNGETDLLLELINNPRQVLPVAELIQSPGNITDLNQKHAVIMIGGKCVILNQTIDPVFNRPDISFSSINDFFNMYANRMTPNPDAPTTTMPIARLWFKSLGRKQYEGLVFEPGKEIPGYYNLWRGFSVEPKKGDWSLMKELILDAIAGGNESRCQYILAWMARIIQDPGGIRPGVAIVIRGRQGIGKGVFANNFGSLINDHFLQVAQAGQVTGRFNTHMKDCVVLFVDEGFWAGDKQAEGVIKNLVTEPTVTVEPKGKDIFRVKNNVNIIIASNADWVVPAGLEERRFFTIDAADCFKGNYDFFRKLTEQMDAGGREAMLYDLKNMDISNVNLRDFERTDALLDQIIESMTLVQKWWFTQLRRGLIKIYSDSDYPWVTSDQWPALAFNNHLYGNFEQFVHKNRGYLPIEAAFGKQLNKLLPPFAMTRAQLIPDGPRKRARIMPSLELCRKVFEKLIEMPVDWEERKYEKKKDVKDDPKDDEKVETIPF